MKKVLLVSTYLLLLIGSPFAVGEEEVLAGSKIPMSRELRDLTDFYERRIRESVREFLGPETRAVVSVYIKGQAVSPGEPNTSVDQVLGGGQSSNSLLVGPYFAASASSRNSEGATDSDYRIESTEVSVQVESSVKPEQRERLANVVKATLREVPVKISIEANLEKASEFAGSKDSTKGRTPASIMDVNVEAPDAYSLFAQRFGVFVPLAAALILLLGVFAISSGLRAAAHEITEGIKTARPSGGGSAIAAPQIRPALPIASESAKIGAGKTSHSRQLGTGTPFELRRNIQTLERYLRESPNLILRSFGDAPEDILGLSYLISRMSPESNALLKDLLGVDRIVKLNAYRTSGEVIGFDVNGWIQNLVERIELKRLAGGDVIEESMTSEQAALLSNVGEEQLLDVAMKQDTPAVWRVVSEFVSSDFLRRGGYILDDHVWMGLVRGAQVTDPVLVKGAVDELVDKLRAAASENAVVLRERTASRQHFIRRILPMLVESVGEREFGEDDRIVDQVLGETPDFAELIYDRIWTPKRLDIVSDASLKGFILGPMFDNERRAYLIYALPEAQARRLETLIPDGTMKKIIVDMAARLRTTSDAEKKMAIRSWVRQFLDAVRVEVAEGRLETKDSARPKSRQVESTEIVEATDERKAS